MANKSIIAARIPHVLLPEASVDLHKWAVIACDQFTSQPEYWQHVADLVGDAPSTYHLILPEVWLNSEEEADRVVSIRQAMQHYLDGGLFFEHDELILVERQVAGRTRHGIMLALDLEHYDYRHGSTSLIRGTEGTILERIPPRVRIRSGAPLELPHILVLIDDPECTVIEPLVEARRGFRTLYDFDLMLDSGHLTGYAVEQEHMQAQVISALERLAEPKAFAQKYALPAGPPPLLFAVGDGNHSLATAKTIWEQIKPTVGLDHPARYALVEVENIHDDGLEFEPILRVLFSVRQDWSQALSATYPGRCRAVPCASVEEMTAMVDAQPPGEHAIGVVTPAGYAITFVADPPYNLPVGTLQNFLDVWHERGGFDRIDYVHGADVAVRLGSQHGNLGFYLPAIDKSDLFKTVIVDGALPRKTFSMGEAREKRFYMEARRIV